MTSHDERSPPEGELPAASPELLLSRRDLLAGGTLGLAAFALGSPAQADDGAAVSAKATFLKVSQGVTGHADLSPTTSDRIYDALESSDGTLPYTIMKLGEIIKQQSDPETIKNAATAIHLDGLVMAIISAWYTGTVSASQGPVVVAYAEALMYRPVADGLTVPTYCSRGPIWWTGLPPEISTMPQNNPKVL